MEASHFENFDQPRTTSGAFSGNRDIALRELLGTDYGFAHDSGLISTFYYNPHTGEDGLMHVLAGEYFIDEDGTRIPRGFHHEPSADAAWIYDSDGNQVGQPRTYVDRTHLETKNARRRKEFRELPFEPYQARVVIDNNEKRTFANNPSTGEVELMPTNNGMFPKEYDALAVMQAIRTARDSRDRMLDKYDDKGEVIIVDGQAPMLDGITPMQIRMVLDKGSERVVSAYPVVDRKGRRFSEDEIKQHLGIIA